jgi:hypothetical protein
MGRVQRATHRSAFVTDRFYRVMNFLEPPSAFFSPRMMAEVLLPGFGGTQRGATTAWGHAPDCRDPQPSRVG